MTTTPYTRRLDNKGRLIIPHRLRQALELNTGDELQFYYENDFIIIRNVTQILLADELAPGEYELQRKRELL